MERNSSLTPEPSSRYVLITILFLVIQVMWVNVSVCQETAGPVLDKRIGVIYKDIHRNILMDITDGSLRNGTRIVIITAPGGSLFCCARVSKRMQESLHSPYTIIINKNKARSYTYLLNVEKVNTDAFYGLDIQDFLDLGFGFTDSPHRFSETGDTVTADLDQDSIQEHFRSCTSHEGVHMTVWSGKPLTGTRLWHAYFYLGYDTEPSCTDEDY